MNSRALPLVVRQLLGGFDSLSSFGQDPNQPWAPVLPLGASCDDNQGNQRLQGHGARPPLPVEQYAADRSR